MLPLVRGRRVCRGAPASSEAEHRQLFSTAVGLPVPTKPASQAAVLAPLATSEAEKKAAERRSEHGRDLAAEEASCIPAA